MNGVRMHLGQHPLTTGTVMVLAGLVVQGGPDGVALAEAQLVLGLQVPELPLHEGIEVQVTVSGDE